MYIVGFYKQRRTRIEWILVSIRATKFSFVIHEDNPIYIPYPKILKKADIGTLNVQGSRFDQHAPSDNDNKP